MSRSVKGKLSKLVFIISLGLVLFQLRGGLWGSFPGIIQDAVQLGFVFVLCFICYRPALGELWSLPYGNDFVLFVVGGASGSLLTAIIVQFVSQGSLHIPWVIWPVIAVVLAAALYVPFRVRAKRGAVLPVDVVLACLAIIVVGYTLVNYERMISFSETATAIDYLMSASLILLVIEAGRRVIGWPMVIVAALFTLYVFFGQHIPGMWGHIDISVNTFLYSMYMTSTGLFGQITAISADLIALFLIYGAMLEVSGSGQSFINIALYLAGRSRGGPAKAAIIASSLFGTISGSPVANAAVVGNLTIPLMKSVGYKSEFAAGVEATASTGGQIMPPIMGVTAFLMAELLGMSYLKIATIAIIPAVAYYAACFFTMHFAACRGNLPPVPADRIPKSLRDALDWKKLFPLIVSIAVLLAMLMKGFSITKSIFWSLVSIIILYLVFGGHPRRVLSRAADIMRGFEAGAKSIITIATVMVLAQLVVSVIGITGVGVKAAGAIASLAGGGRIWALLLAAVVTLILGMGMPPLAAYTICVGVLLSSITATGLPPIVAHFFLFYYAAMAAITPPVCAAVFVTAAIGRCSWLGTARYALYLGYVGLVVPMVFAFRPSLLLIGTPLTILMDTSILFVGLVCISAGLAGYLFRPLVHYERALLIAGGVLLYLPIRLTDILGLAVIATAFLLARFSRVKNAKQLT